MRAINRGIVGHPSLALPSVSSHPTSGFTGATNDKTIIRYDAAVNKINNDNQYKGREYKLRKADGTYRERKGCYLIVDNGYHEVNYLDQ